MRARDGSLIIHYKYKSEFGLFFCREFTMLEKIHQSILILMVIKCTEGPSQKLKILLYSEGGLQRYLLSRVSRCVIEKIKTCIQYPVCPVCIIV